MDEFYRLVKELEATTPDNRQLGIEIRRLIIEYEAFLSVTLEKSI